MISAPNLTSLTMRYQFCISLAALLCVQASAVTPGSTAVVALLETTDVHSNVLGYDYFRLAPDPSLGLERTATLIAEARKQYPNNLLFDNGDTIQGTALADYEALVKPLACDKTLAVYKAMNALGFDGGGIGNHEFNYGLAYLSQVTGNRFDVAGVDPSRPRCAGPRRWWRSAATWTRSTTRWSARSPTASGPSTSRWSASTTRSR